MTKKHLGLVAVLLVVCFIAEVTNKVIDGLKRKKESHE